MDVAKAAMPGIVVKAALMAAVVLACVFAARLSANKIVRNNPGWSQQWKEAAHFATTMTAVIVVALLVITIASR